ncbi:hypothetical protein [Methanolacinia petrolearia]|uniref:hypothetical protein n=1 Tax=Methanolacinia petrolearia TaxID=54120 RepID=UPI003BAC1546
MLKKISFRLGMEGGLLIGICLGVLTAAAFILCMLLLLSPNETAIIVVTVALILASILCSGIVIWMQDRRKKSQIELCTCRYRSSLYTYCRKCALKEIGNNPPEEMSSPEK